jgi:hypothetical protein
MKKLTNLLIAAAMLAGMTVTTAYADERAAVAGDMNGDVLVSLEDIQAILDYWAGSLNDGAADADSQRAFFAEKYSVDDAQFDAVDIDEDGMITGMDAEAIRIYIICRDWTDADYELTKENLPALRETAQKAVNDNYLVGYCDDDGVYRIVSDKEKFCETYVVFEFAYKTGTKPTGLDSVFTGNYYELERADGITEVYSLPLGFTFGDVNKDGEVNSLDATEVLIDYAEKLINEAAADSDTTERNIRSDYNKDGEIDSLDATAILVDYAEELNK